VIRALLCDVEGTLLVDGAALPGAPEALRAAVQAGIAVRFVTNTTTRPRAQVARELRGAGFDVPDEYVFSALRAGREYLARRGVARAMLLVTEAARADFDGVAHDEDAPAAVVVGDLLDAWTAAMLQRAFERLLEGAELVALVKSRYYRRGGRLLLDAGPYVAALEHASGREATLVGKPSPEFFRLALSTTGVPPAEAVVVGDDLEADVGGAQGAGMRGLLVRTGKFRAQDLARPTVAPDAVLASVADLPGWLSGSSR